MSRSYQGCRTILDRSTRYREAIRITIGKSWRSSIDSKVSRRYWGGVEPAFKISFSRCEKHRHECNPISNSTSDPLNILSFQNHLSIIILSTWISKKKHTHTHNKSRQFSEHTLTDVKPYDGQITLYLHMYQEYQRILRVVCEKYRKIA